MRGAIRPVHDHGTPYSQGYPVREVRYHPRLEIRKLYFTVATPPLMRVCCIGPCIRGIATIQGGEIHPRKESAEGRGTVGHGTTLS